MNKLEGQYQHNSFPRKITFLFVLIFLFGPLFNGFSLAAPAELLLNTEVPIVSEFTITEESPIEITLGTDKTVGYTYRGNKPIYLTITSMNASASKAMRMKHKTLNYYIPYTMTFGYSGGNQQTPVTSDLKKQLEGFAGTNESSGNFVITTEEGGAYLEGDYADTITFTFTAT